MSESVFEIHDWTLSVDDNMLCRPDREVYLEPRLVNLLRFLASNAGTVFGRDCLINEVWDGAEVTDQVVTQSIFELRKILKDGRTDATDYIVTVPKRGYKLVEVGKTFVYEFVMTKSGTFMYHPHADEMLQMAMGMMGLFIVHPKNPSERHVDRDYAFLLASYKVDPGSLTPNPSEMLDFNVWSFNNRVFPAIAPLVAKTGERVRIRVGNLTMTNHPIHLHGVTFKVTGTDGGWVPPSAQWPEVTTDVPVGGMRVIEFVADAPGDWALHCHKSHHTMGAMGHGTPNLLGVKQSGVDKKIQKLFPDKHYMSMGESGMAEMQDMAAMGKSMPLPDNTIPMMTGEGPFGALEMGGMFTVLKVRDGLKAGDYRDPGWYRHPKGTVAYLID